MPYNEKEPTMKGITMKLLTATGTPVAKKVVIKELSKGIGKYALFVAAFYAVYYFVVASIELHKETQEIKKLL